MAIVLLALKGIRVEDLKSDKCDDSQQERFKVLAEMRKSFAGVTPEKIEREVAQAIAEVRWEERLLADGQVRRFGMEEHRGDEVEK